MRDGELAVAIEIPPNFGRDIARGTVQIGVWVDGAMPNRAETVRGYVQAMHLAAAGDGRPAEQPAARYLAHLHRDPLSLQSRCEEPAGHRPGGDPAAADDDPAMLSALSVVRERARIDYQLVRDANHPQRIPARQAAALHRTGDV